MKEDPFQIGKKSGKVLQGKPEKTIGKSVGKEFHSGVNSSNRRKPGSEFDNNDRDNNGYSKRSNVRDDSHDRNRGFGRDMNRDNSRGGYRGNNRDIDRSNNREVNRNPDQDSYRSNSRGVNLNRDRDNYRGGNRGAARNRDQDSYRGGNRGAARNRGWDSSQKSYRDDNRDVNKDVNREDKRAELRSEERGEGTEEIAFREDLIEGRNPVMEALRSGRTIDKIYVSAGEKEGSIRQILSIAKEKRIVVTETEKSKLDSMSQSHSHQGIIAVAAVKDYVEVEDILEVARQKGEPPFILLLDEITDPHNLGSILRTADASGVHGVIIPKRRSVGLSSIVAKTSAGAVEYVPVARVSNLAQTIEQLKKQNIWVMGADMEGEQPFYKHDLKGPLALVIGSEGEGMGKLVKESCDFLVRISMKGKISSLNASVAGAVIMYEVFKQRNV